MTVKNPRVRAFLSTTDARSTTTSVAALAAVFNTADPHVQRALFHHACTFVGLPADLTQTTDLALLEQATQELRTGLQNGSLRMVRDRVVVGRRKGQP